MASFLMLDNSIARVVFKRNGLDQVVFYSGVSIELGSIETVGLIPQVSGSLHGFLNASTSYVDIYDQSGNLIVSKDNSTIEEYINVVANERYYLALHRTDNVLGGNQPWLTLQMFETPSVSDSFEGGFVTNQPFIAGITSATDTNGVLTYTFNSVPLTLGQTTGLTLGYTGLALKNGTITMTSSDPTVFPDISDGFVPNVVFQFQFQSLKTTVFTGTIVISVDGAGVLGPVSTMAVGILGGGFNTNNVKLKRPRKIMKSITPGLVDTSKKNKTNDNDDEAFESI